MAFVQMKIPVLSWMHISLYERYPFFVLGGRAEIGRRQGLYLWERREGQNWEIVQQL